MEYFRYEGAQFFSQLSNAAVGFFAGLCSPVPSVNPRNKPEEAADILPSSLLGEQAKEAKRSQRSVIQQQRMYSNWCRRQAPV